MNEVEDAIRAAYDAVAGAYAQRFADELLHKPIDRALLGAFLEQLPSRDGLVADVGCGPGHVARYLSSLGARVIGIDLSPAMVAIARRLDPTTEYKVANMLSLPAKDGDWGGIVAFYSIIHLEPAEIAAALAEFFRTLTNQGLLIISIHLGSEVRHVDEFLGEAVSLNFRFIELADLRAEIVAAGFDVLMSLERSPYQPHEVSTQRGYVLARKP